MYHDERFRDLSSKLQRLEDNTFRNMGNNEYIPYESNTNPSIIARDNDNNDNDNNNNNNGGEIDESNNGGEIDKTFPKFRSVDSDDESDDDTNKQNNNSKSKHAFDESYDDDK